MSLATRVVSRRTVHKKLNQHLLALIGILVAVLGGIVLYRQRPLLSVIWFFGLGFGITLQKSRFCFAAAARDPLLTGSTSLARGVIIALATTSFGFAALQYSAQLKGASLPGYILPVSPAVAIGALMFGFGMVIAGACASGTLMRIGEGYVMQWLVLVGFLIGTLWGAHDFAWWNRTLIAGFPAVHLPTLLGWPVGLAVHFGLLLGLYVLATWWEYRGLA